MGKGVVLGTFLGVFGMPSGWILAYAAHELLFWGGIGHVDLLTHFRRTVVDMLLFAGPGTAILTLLLSALIRRRRFAGKRRASALALCLALGVALEMLNIVAIVLALGGLEGLRDRSYLSAYSIALWSAGVAGGLGLGLGCFWGLPKEAA
jgi:hypothetical protein